MSAKDTEKKTSPGRPDAASSTDVRSGILETAEDFFATKGYAATSVREIAERAGVNPAMIHYYFGNKESLLKAVLEKALAPLGIAIESMKQADRVSPGEMIQILMDIVASHPRLPYLVIREVMLPGGVMQAHFAKNMAPKLGGAILGLLGREIQAGRISSDPPPAIGALALMSLAIFPFIVRPVAEQVLDLRMSGAAVDELKKHISIFTEKGFAP